MDFGLKGKVALVAGGGRGGGLEICECLCAEGASVFLSSRENDVLAAAINHLRNLGGVASGKVTDMTTASGATALHAAVKKRVAAIRISS